jgi:hypothetical protein
MIVLVLRTLLAVSWAPKRQPRGASPSISLLSEELALDLQRCQTYKCLLCYVDSLSTSIQVRGLDFNDFTKRSLQLLTASQLLDSLPALTYQFPLKLLQGP